MATTHRRRDLDERGDVISWRRRQLTAAGFDPAVASTLAADRRWDLHALLQLLERGCPPPLALRIQSPTDEGEMST